MLRWTSNLQLKWIAGRVKLNKKQKVRGWIQLYIWRRNAEKVISREQNNDKVISRCMLQFCTTDISTFQEFPAKFGCLSGPQSGWESSPPAGPKFHFQETNSFNYSWLAKHSPSERFSGHSHKRPKFFKLLKFTLLKSTIRTVLYKKEIMQISGCQHYDKNQLISCSQ